MWRQRHSGACSDYNHISFCQTALATLAATCAHTHTHTHTHTHNASVSTNAARHKINCSVRALRIKPRPPRAPQTVGARSGKGAPSASLRAHRAHSLRRPRVAQICHFSDPKNPQTAHPEIPKIWFPRTSF